MTSILDSIQIGLPSRYARDEVAVYNEDYVQLFQLASAIKVRVNPSAKLMQHPAETGVMMTDHIVYNPIVIELSLIVASEDYKNVYEEVFQTYMNATLVSVHTKAKIFDNQLIEALPHEESPERHNTLLIALRLQQIQIVSSQLAIEPKDPINESTIDRGTQVEEPEIVIPQVDLLARIRGNV